MDDGVGLAGERRNENPVTCSRKRVAGQRFVAQSARDRRSQRTMLAVDAIGALHLLYHASGRCSAYISSVELLLKEWTPTELFQLKHGSLLVVIESLDKQAGGWTRVDSRSL